jgi:flagellar protein FlgJ
MINRISTADFTRQPDTGPSEGKLRQVCAEFESLLLATMLKSMGSAAAHMGLLGKTHESDLMRSMRDETLAVDIAKKGGIGLGEVLFNKLNRPGIR